MIKKEIYNSIIEDPDETAITSELSESNYCNKFHQLLCWEELQHIEDLKNRYVYIE